MSDETSEQFDVVFGGSSGESSDAALEAEVAEFEAAHAEESAPEEEVSVDPAASKDHGEAQAESAPIPKAEPKVEKGGDVVPLAVFLEQKNELRELRRQVEEMRSPPKQEQAPQPEGPPVFQPTAKMEDDPATYLREQGEHLAALQDYHARQLAQVQAWAAHQSRSAQENAARANFTQVVNNAEEQFRTSNPDYDQALDYLRNVELRKARAAVGELGADFNEAHAYAQITNDFATIAGHALQRGVNPAAVIYRMAKELGFKAAPPPSAVERIEKGVQASKSSQAMGGRTTAPAESTGDFFKDLQRAQGYRK